MLITVSMTGQTGVWQQPSGQLSLDPVKESIGKSHAPWVASTACSSRHDCCNACILLLEVFVFGHCILSTNLVKLK